MKVKTHKPEPVAPPPPTYDLIGLTEAEYHYIAALVGGNNAGALTKTGGDSLGYDLYSAFPSSVRLNPLYQQTVKSLNEQRGILHV